MIEELKLKDGKKLYSFAKRIINFNRSLTGEGVTKTLVIIKKKNPNLRINKIKSGTKVYDWIVPKVWNISEAYIIGPRGKKIVDFKNNNLHIISYSKPINKILSLDELLPHLYSIKDQPNAIPYLTSYYKKIWGFCISYKLKKHLKKGMYRVVIKSSFKKDYMTYGELLIKGQLKKEIILTTNICHPSMANNETSGITILTFLANLINNYKLKKFSYRILFLPETIGSIAYIHKNYKKLINNTYAGIVLSCLGDNRNYSYMTSKYENTITDKIINSVFENYIKKFKKYSFLSRGSDERQFSSPGVNLPFCSVMRSKYGTYNEYHNSLDNMKLISNKSLVDSFNLLIKIINLFEINNKYKTKIKCEPFLTKHNLYPTLSTKKTKGLVENISNIITYCDGSNDLVDLSKIIKKDPFYIYKIISMLRDKKIII